VKWRATKETFNNEQYIALILIMSSKLY